MNQKLENLKAFLSERKVEHWENARLEGKTPITVDLFLPKYNISVHVGQDDEFYRTVKGLTHPIFIREDELSEFVIEKVCNTMEKQPYAVIPSRAAWFRHHLIPSAVYYRKAKKKKKGHKSAHVAKRIVK